MDNFDNKNIETLKKPLNIDKTYRMVERRKHVTTIKFSTESMKKTVELLFK